MARESTSEANSLDGVRREEPDSVHSPVLFQEALHALQVRAGGRYIDATLGGGGHAAGILAASSPSGNLLGLDRDPDAVALAQLRLASYGDRAVLAVGSFERLLEVARSFGFELVDGILFDLGLSSLQLADPARGFSFRADGPLDMRYNPEEEGPTAGELVNSLSCDDLERILRRYGEEEQSRRISQAIVSARPIHSARDLAYAIEGVVRRRGRIHPATKTFQALRIVVNDELAVIEKALPQAVELLTGGGRLAVISFHSLEDRIVKRFLRRESRDCICPPEVPVCVCGHRATLRLVTRKPIRPGVEELGVNPRARSARLRVAERVSE